MDINLLLRSTQLSAHESQIPGVLNPKNGGALWKQGLMRTTATVIVGALWSMKTGTVEDSRPLPTGHLGP